MAVQARPVPDERACGSPLKEPDGRLRLYGSGEEPDAVLLCWQEFQVARAIAPWLARFLFDPPRTESPKFTGDSAIFRTADYPLVLSAAHVLVDADACE